MIPIVNAIILHRMLTTNSTQLPINTKNKISPTICDYITALIKYLKNMTLSKNVVIRSKT